MQKQIDLTVIVPAYNEKENMEPLARAFLDMIRANSFSVEVLVIDDGSSDGTWDVVRRLMDRYSFLRLVEHRKNLGKTAAIQTGIRNSCGDSIVIFDADLQFDPFDIPRLYNKLHQGYDIVTGKKIGNYQKPLVSGIYNRISRMLFKVPVTDMNSIKIFRRHVMQGIPLRKDWHRYMIVLAVDRGYSVTEIDVTLRPRLHGVSKFRGPGRMLVGFFDLLAVWFLLSFMKKPMMFFGTMGFFSTLFGGLLGIGILVGRLVYDWGYPPLQTLVVLLLQLGFTSFIFGALAEMVASLREKIDLLNPTASAPLTKSGRRERTKSDDRDKKGRGRESRRSEREAIGGAIPERKERKRDRDVKKSEKPERRKPDRDNADRFRADLEQIEKPRFDRDRRESQRPDRDRSDIREKGRPERRSYSDEKSAPATEKIFIERERPEEKFSSRKDKPVRDTVSSERKRPFEDKTDIPPTVIKREEPAQEPVSFGRGKRKTQAAAPTEKKEKGFSVNLGEDVSFGRNLRKKTVAEPQPEKTDTVPEETPVKADAPIIEITPLTRKSEEPKPEHVEPVEAGENKPDEFEQQEVQDQPAFGRGHRKTFSVPSEPSAAKKSVDTENISFGRGKRKSQQ